jgi:hypothetical protein
MPPGRARALPFAAGHLGLAGTPIVTHRARRRADLLLVTILRVLPDGVAGPVHGVNQCPPFVAAVRDETGSTAVLFFLAFSRTAVRCAVRCPGALRVAETVATVALHHAGAGHVRI